MWRVWVMLCSKERFEKAFAHYWQEAIENVTFVYLGKYPFENSSYTLVVFYSYLTQIGSDFSFLEMVRQVELCHPPHIFRSR